MGRAAEDGSFDEFQKKVLALDVQLEGLSATCETLRGDRLSFGWDAPFVVNEEEQPLAGFMHYEGPFSITELPASQMDIVYGEYAVRLHFEPQDEVEMLDDTTSDEEPSA
jgi:hypothetical protein